MVLSGSLSLETDLKMSFVLASTRGGDPGGVGGVRTPPEIETSHLWEGQGGSSL